MNIYLSYLNRAGLVSLLSNEINFKISRKRILLIVAQNTECEVAGFQILSISTRFHWKYPRAYHKPMNAFISMTSVTFKERYKIRETKNTRRVEKLRIFLLEWHTNLTLYSAPEFVIKFSETKKLIKNSNRIKSSNQFRTKY